MEIMYVHCGRKTNISDFVVMNTTELVFEIRPKGLFGSNRMTSS